MSNRIHDYDYALKLRFQHKLLIAFIYILIIYILISLILKFLVFPVIVKSDSMSPQLQKSDCVFVTPITTASSNNGQKFIKRGDIVYVCENVTKSSSIKRFVDSVVGFVTLQKIFPFNTRTNHKSTLRRVIALPGDTVYIKDYNAYIKLKDSSHFLTEFEVIDTEYELISKFDNIDQNLGSPGVLQEIVLQKDEYFLLCDNRIEGIDSRIWGPVNIKRINGAAILRYFPFNKFGSL